MLYTCTIIDITVHSVYKIKCFKHYTSFIKRGGIEKPNQSFIKTKCSITDTCRQVSMRFSYLVLTNQISVIEWSTCYLPTANDQVSKGLEGFG